MAVLNNISPLVDISQLIGRSSGTNQRLPLKMLVEIFRHYPARVLRVLPSALRPIPFLPLRSTLLLT
ncbi:hypothetical protein K443DRAFT_510546 [Laccaria amethystina LaAM-08-1]|uniref:Uncharacterized protein n=1 Tax=Laccaria amethystina LaAM-08-1 TaxID=1095629 RepID=A0A0C9X3B8_9AGAR|nr:hypothetical protein K443DRAFT_510546 [Laccaria amethystina LaAM-08-1]